MLFFLYNVIYNCVSVKTAQAEITRWDRLHIIAPFNSTNIHYPQFLQMDHLRCCGFITYESRI